MGTIRGKGTVVTINAVNISAFTNTVTFADSDDVEETTTYGPVRRKTYAATLGDGTITIGGLYDDGATGPRATLKPLKAAGNPVAFVYQPEGAGSGKPQSVVDVIVTSFNESSPVGGMVTWTSELQMTGTLNEADQA